jgi:hypothetical protein
MTDVAVMIDAIASNSDHIPADTPNVCGYNTGTPGIKWSAANWARFPGAGHFILNQGDTWEITEILGCNGFDVETKAVTPVQAAQGVKDRIAAGITWTTIYGSDQWLADVAGALRALGPDWYFGHVDCGLANWNLNSEEAAKLIGTKIHGLTCRAVQWASPTSNPETLVPGTLTTLEDASVDLWVVEAAWLPRTPPPPAWQAQALALTQNVAEDLARLEQLLAAHQ